MRAAEIRNRKNRRGFILVTAGVAALLLVGALGMAVDLGRMFIVRSEAQNFVDSMALEAAVELDGTSEGLARAAAVPAASKQKYDLGRYKFEQVDVTFGMSPEGPWQPAGSAAGKSRFARALARTEVPMYFLSALTSQGKGRVHAAAVAAQVEKRTFSEGLFPFSPFAHNGNPPHFGLIPGQVYTLRWPSNPSLGNQGGGNGNTNVCVGDRVQELVDMANAQGGSERGYIEQNSADIIRQTIINDFQSVTRTVGDLVELTGGAKQSQLDSLLVRILQDTDPASTTYAQYSQGNEGNGRRIIACPINDGGTPPGTGNRIVGIGAFFLRRTGEYGNGGNQSWCAEYIGAWVQGSNHKAVEESGAWVVRLVK